MIAVGLLVSGIACGVPKDQVQRDLDMLREELNAQQEAQEAKLKSRLDASQLRIKALEQELESTQAEQVRIKTRAAVTSARSWLLQAQVAVMDKRFRDAVFAAELARTALDRLEAIDSAIAKSPQDRLISAMSLLNAQSPKAAVSLGAAAQSLSLKDEAAAPTEEGELDRSSEGESEAAPEVEAESPPQP